MRSSRQDTNRDAQVGMSLVEVMMAALILPVLLSSIFMATQNFGHVQDVAVGAATVTKKLRSSVRRIGDELRSASKFGEDRNRNGNLDIGEDINGNGRLESDWAVTPTSITFNRMLADGTYSLPISYALLDDTLVMRRKLTVEDDLDTIPITGSVSGFSVLETAKQLIISVSVTRRKRGGGTEVSSSNITIVRRN